jgi:hypothetical protein
VNSTKFQKYYDPVVVRTKKKPLAGCEGLGEALMQKLHR